MTVIFSGSILAKFISSFLVNSVGVMIWVDFLAARLKTVLPTCCLDLK